MIEGTISIKNICNEGQKNGPDGWCYPEVKYYENAGLTLQQAKNVCIEKGWVLATPDEVAQAWNKLGLNVYAYGLMENGEFAVPVQRDYSNYKKGTNIGATGGNQGFLYVLAVAVDRSYDNTKDQSASTDSPSTMIDNEDEGNIEVTPQSISEYYELNNVPFNFTNSEIQKFRDLTYKYRNGIGNIIQDKWNDSNYYFILDEALKRYIQVKLPYRYRDDSFIYDYMKSKIIDKDPNCAECKSYRYEYIGFFVGEYLDALREKRNPFLNQQFAEYAGYHQARASRETLDAWAYYSRRGTAKLNEPYIPGEHFGAGPTLIDPKDIENVPYKPVTLSILSRDADPLPGKSIEDFNRCCKGDSPLYLSRDQSIMLRDFMLPLGANYVSNTQYIDDRLLAIPNYLGENLDDFSGLIAASGGVGVGAVGMSAVGLGAAAYSSVIAAKAGIVGKVIVTETFTAITGEIITKEVVKQVVKDATIFSKELGTKAIGPSLKGAIGPIAIGVAVFAAGFQNTGGKAIALAVFENNLKNDCYYKPYNIDWNNAQPGEQIVGFGWLFKMIVLDAPGLTYGIPETKSSVTEQNSLETSAVIWGRKNNPSRSALYDQVLLTAGDRYVNKNVARSMPAKQSTTFSNAFAYKAVDGKTDGRFSSRTTSLTAKDNKSPWWEVDLGEEINITSIRVFGRTDGNLKQQLNNYSIVIRDGSGLFLYASNQPNPGNTGAVFNKKTKGRYVRIEMPTVDDLNMLALAEVEVYGTPTSLYKTLAVPYTETLILSKNKVTRQSSTYGGRVASNAIDGKTDGNYFNNTISTTNYEESPWWEIDLGQSYDITYMRVFPRTDCCHERLNNFSVLVSEEPFKSNKDGKVFGANQGVNSNAPLDLVGNQKGRYVRIFLVGTNHMSLAEVEIFGRK
ncbi:MAG: hypothetical protein HKN68_17635 [Saprospiraceae bacterium]|nr:hypothetical protein [Saprospiraceae bacterium]